MDDEQKIPTTLAGKNYMFVVGTYTGTSKELRYMLRAELRGEVKTTYFLLGILNPMNVYAQETDVDTEELYHKAVEAISEFIQSEWIEGATYYGELLEDGKFYITGKEKPNWDDGNWGQKANI